MVKRLSALIENCNIKNINGQKECLIEGIAYDSRKVKKNFAFFALTGIHTDGHNYIDTAIKNGASALFISRPLPVGTVLKNVTSVLVDDDDTRKAMAFFSAAFYNYPEKKIKIIGVTGTDGKSTTVSFIYQLLNMIGKKTGFISTVQYDATGIPEKNPYRQSTPESPEIMEILSKMVENNFEYAVLESTSHGLSDKTNRLVAIDYAAGILTNISHEHLEFHGTMENYINDKTNLFKKSQEFCVLNISDPAAEIFRKAAKSQVLTYSLTDTNANFYASDISASSSALSFTINCNSVSHKGVLSFPGAFNIENFLAAAITASSITKTTIDTIIPLSSKIKPVTGRMETVNMGQPFTVIVDYAHTPGAFEKIFPMIHKTVEGRLISLFGSAGERDVEKRPIQGAIASKYSDILIIADEDPREENAMGIIDQIAEGAIKSGFDKSAVYKIADRFDAIKKAISLAKVGDTIILLGKGHESSIIYKDNSIPWNEREVAEKALSEAGYSL